MLYVVYLSRAGICASVGSASARRSARLGPPAPGDDRTTAAAAPEEPAIREASAAVVEPGAPAPTAAPAILCRPACAACGAEWTPMLERASVAMSSSTLRRRSRTRSLRVVERRQGLFLSNQTHEEERGGGESQLAVSQKKERRGRSIGRETRTWTDGGIRTRAGRPARSAMVGKARTWSSCVVPVCCLLVAVSCRLETNDCSGDCEATRAALKEMRLTGSRSSRERLSGGAEFRLWVFGNWKEGWTWGKREREDGPSLSLWCWERETLGRCGAAREACHQSSYQVHHQAPRVSQA